MQIPKIDHIKNFKLIQTIDKFTSEGLLFKPMFYKKELCCGLQKLQTSSICTAICLVVRGKPAVGERSKHHTFANGNLN